MHRINLAPMGNTTTESKDHDDGFQAVGKKLAVEKEKTNSNSSSSSSSSSSSIGFSSPISKTSPVKPIVDTPPKGFIAAESFYYHKPPHKDSGLSPNGTTLIPLNEREGAAHHIVRAEIDGEVKMVRGDKRLLSPEKHDFELCKLQLLAQLKDLKSRADLDFTKNKNGGVDPNHFKAAIFDINKCIASMRNCYKLSGPVSGPEREEFVAYINKCFASRTYYNPFSLREIYKDSGYDTEYAEDLDNFSQPVALEKFEPKRRFNSFSSSSSRNLFNSKSNETTMPDSSSSSSSLFSTLPLKAPVNKPKNTRLSEKQVSKTIEELLALYDTEDEPPKPGMK